MILKLFYDSFCSIQFKQIHLHYCWRKSNDISFIIPEGISKYSKLIFFSEGQYTKDSLLFHVLRF